jgi:hypothetical protein
LHAIFIIIFIFSMYGKICMVKSHITNRWHPYVYGKIPHYEQMASIILIMADAARLHHHYFTKMEMPAKLKKKKELSQPILNPYKKKLT